MKIRNLLFISMILSSCEKTIHIPLPEASGKPVLNLLMNKDSVMMARVTLSGRMNDFYEMKEVKNAVVNLYENGVFKEMLTPVIRDHYTYYRSESVPKAGAEYRVTAAIQGYEQVSGTDRIPDTVRTGEMKMFVPNPDGWDPQGTFSVQIHDDPAVQNYYRIRFYIVNEWTDASGIYGFYKNILYFETQDATLPMFDNDYQTEFYTTDELFNGRSPKFLFKASVGGTRTHISAEITSLTAQSYKYLLSAYMARAKNDDVLSEKVIVYNNIQNGFGIIGGVAKREYPLAE